MKIGVRYLLEKSTKPFASREIKIVRDLALRMEEEGLISVVMLPTPLGLVIAQKREGRG